MLFDADIFVWERPASAVGRLCLVLLSMGVLGCDRSRNDPSKRLDGGSGPVANESNEAETKRRSQRILKQLEEEQARLKAEIREFERVRNLPPFENALEPAGQRRLSRAFVVKKDGDDGVLISERLFGRMPLDPERYVPGDRPQGLYLVGSLAPLGGYEIDRFEGEERFCLGISSDGEHLEGEGVSAGLSMSEVKRRLQAALADGGSGVR